MLLLIFINTGVLTLPAIMTGNLQERNNKQVATWLLIGVGMIIVQVLIGGITRLTESGLSITEWKPITGALPPMNDMAWQQEFDKYRTTDQFKYVHQHFSLSDFKFIFFWEWFHRLWARLLGVVFLIGFVYFVVKKKFSREMVMPMIILFVLGALQGLVGWLMVKSGLVPEKFYVGHVELTTHLIAAIILLFYTAWFAYSLLPAMQVKVEQKNIRGYLYLIFGLLFFQLVYGGFMAGLKAAASAPTWPDINGSLLPLTMFDLSPWAKNLADNPIMIHFIHRGLGYLLMLFVALYFFQSKKIIHHRLFAKLSNIFLLLFITQVGLGILTVVNSTDKMALVWLGVSHQFVAMLIVLCGAALLFLSVKPGRLPA
jgi:cytochrome c oxidase assembly protein subunit 15